VSGAPGPRTTLPTMANGDGLRRFEGKVAVVTGAASGMGRAITIRLADEGAAVLAHDLDPDGLAGTAKLVADAGGTIRTRTGDVSSRGECVATVAAAVDAFGRLDVLGNVAGIVRCEHFTDVSEEQYRRMMGVNIDAYFFLAQAAIPHLLESGGNIVNIASNAGLMGQAYTVVYCMTKGAVVQLTRSLAMEYAKTTLRVNALAPAGTNTNLVNTFAAPDDVDGELMVHMMGFRGMNEPEQVAAIFAFVASADGEPFTGAILSCDRGVTAG
jgi:meso-butanediol dehydrogenase/(S,S)-butanediol dehydrogenase/diacetyl reductase